MNIKQQTLIDRSGQSSLQLQGDWTSNALFFHLILILYRSQSQIFQFMAFIIIIILLSHITALEIPTLSSSW